MNSPIPPPENQRPNDPVLQRYREANAHDPARPSPALRDRVLAHARAMARESKAPEGGSHLQAANDGTWKLRALGSLAVLGLVGLLMLQFDRGTPEERTSAWGPSTQPSADASDEAQSKPGLEPAPAPAHPTFPAPQIHGSGAAEGERQAIQQPARPASAPASGPGAKAPRASVETGSMQADAGRAASHDDHSARRAQNPDLAEAPAVNRASPKALAADAEAEAPSSAAGRALKDGSAAPSQATTSSTALHVAAIKGDTEAVVRLIEGGLPVDTRDSAGRTALMLAAKGPSRAVIEQLLKGGASRQVRDHVGLNAADHARRADRPEWVSLLEP